MSNALSLAASKLPRFSVAEDARVALVATNKARCDSLLATHRRLVTKVETGGVIFTSPTEQALSHMMSETMRQFSSVFLMTQVEGEVRKHTLKSNGSLLHQSCFLKAEEFLRNWAASKEPLTLKTLLRAHEYLLSSETQDMSLAKGGIIRTKRVHVGKDRSFPAPEEVPALLDGFIVDFNTLAADAKMSAVYKATWLLFSFINIHPFLDGNGRIGRLLANTFLRIHGLPFFCGLVGSHSDRAKFTASKHGGETASPRWWLTFTTRCLERGENTSRPSLAMRFRW